MSAARRAIGRWVARCCAAMREGRHSSARIRRRGLLVRRTTASTRVRVGAVFLGHCDKPVGTLEDAGRPLRHLAPELRLADGIARRSARSTEEAPSACYEVCDGFFWGLRCKAAPTVVLLPRVRASAPYWVALHSSGAMERVFGSRGWRSLEAAVRPPNLRFTTSNPLIVVLALISERLNILSQSVSQWRPVSKQ